MRLNITYPQNYIFKKPVYGAMILFGFSVFFLLSYKPLDVERSMLLDFEWTIFAYAVIASLVALLTIWLLKKIPYFSDSRKWTLLKELVAAYVVMQVIGIAIFLGGFILEDTPEVSRWNWPTFIDSCINAFLIEVFPFGFFTLMNFNKRLKPKEEVNYQKQDGEKSSRVIEIESTLKKESLSFRIDDFLFAEADGNYVEFNLKDQGKVKKVSIRNSIGAIDKQMEEPVFFRCHRAFIVNMDKVTSKRGNSLGYALGIEGTHEHVPVSRSKVDEFNALTEA